MMKVFPTTSGDQRCDVVGCAVTSGRYVAGEYVWLDTNDEDNWRRYIVVSIVLRDGSAQRLKYARFFDEKGERRKLVETECYLLGQYDLMPVPSNFGSGWGEIIHNRIFLTN